ncbi:ribulose bisphosphate carboxylase small subunit [Nocardioides hungaricus]|jgi:ribulose-bisphosphate carboxylase small chain|nr:ribulose bisphosphate carboxylase small subunit [Candidatus Nanopelagicales bacterium]
MSKIHYGTFSYLPDLTDEEIAAQVKYALDHEWPVSIEYTDDPHPRNIYWEMWGLPMFDLIEPDGVLTQINECRTAKPEHYIRVLAYDARLGKQTTAMSFLVQTPTNEPGLLLVRQDAHDRVQHYSVKSYATDRPTGTRYAGE